MPRELLTKEQVRFTRAELAACNEHLGNGGPRLGCPVCFIRAEYAIVAIMKRAPELVFSAAEAVIPELRAHTEEGALQ